MPVTTLHEVLGRVVPMDEVKAAMRSILERTFSLRLSDISESELVQQLTVQGIDAGTN
jgi:hypothetical protein